MFISLFAVFLNQQDTQPDLYLSAYIATFTFIVSL